jgi:effector-binding domain-containing protein
MLTEPKIERRDAVPYMGIRAQTPMNELPTFIRQSLGKLFPWVRKRGAQPAGPPFIRFHAIDMSAKLDVEVGIPISGNMAGEGQIQPSVLSSGRYVSLVYTGVDNGIAANAALLDWAAKQGLVLDRWDTPDGDAFAGRFESFLTDAAEEPDPEKWETEVAIRLAEA